MIYKFENFTLNSRDYLFSRDQQVKSLEPRVFDVLAYLIENRERVVSKDELIEKLWDGRVISDSALNTCIRSIRRTLGDDREQQKFVRTFPKRGFQFVGVIEVVSPSTTGGTSATPSNGISSAPPNKDLRMRAGLLVMGFILLVLVLIESGLFRTEGAELSTKPSIAVLDFGHRFRNETERYFTEGLVEELVGSLARYRQLFVIARNSSALFNPEKHGIKQIGRELGADYIVDGNVRYDDSLVKISARLIDARSGQQIWSDEFERPRAEIYDLQGDLAYLIAGQVVPELVRSDAQRNHKKSPEVLDAWALYHKARTMQAVYRRDMQENAIHWAQLALVRDPNLAAAHGVIARAKGTLFFFGWTDNPDDMVAEAIASARLAISLDTNDPGAYAALGYIYRYTGDETSSIANLERATMLNPSDASIKLEYAHTLDWFRHQQKALPEINQALKLSPRDPRLENMYFYKAHILFHLHQYEQSLETTRKMSGVLTTDVWRTFYHLMRAANFAQLEQFEEAQGNINAALKINPKLSLSAMRKRFEGSNNHPENRNFWLASLHKAGLPE